MSETRIETLLLIAFLDLTRFFAQIRRTDDAEITETLAAFYEHVATAVGAAGGTRRRPGWRRRRPGIGESDWRRFGLPPGVVPSPE